jgi:D-aminopeptidase
VALERIEHAATRAVQRVGEIKPYVLTTPVELEMTFSDSSMAASVARIPRVERCAERAIRYVSPTVQEAYDVCSIALVLAGALARRERL